MEEPNGTQDMESVICTLTYTAPDDDAVWRFTPGLRVWSTQDGLRYLLDDDFRAVYPSAPAAEQQPSAH